MSFLKSNKFLISLLLASIPFATIANVPKFDSISKVVSHILTNTAQKNISIGNRSKTFQADTARIKKYQSIAVDYQNEYYDSLLFYSQKALDLSIRIEYLPSISRSIQLLARYFLFKEDYRTSTEYLLLSLKIEEQQNNKKRIADLNDELGTIYYYQEIFRKSLAYFTAALNEYEKEHDTFNLAKVYSHLGNLYSSREYCEQRTTDQKRVDFNTAIQYFEKSVLLCNQMDYKPLMINGYVNLAAVYNKLVKPEKALIYLNQANDYYRKTNDQNGLASSLYTTGVTYNKLKQYDLSTKSFEESLKIDLDNHFTDGIQYLYEDMAHNYKESQEYKKALDYYIKYMTIRDSINSLGKSNELFELETKYQTEKKEKEILQLKTEKREKNIVLFTLLGLILILASLGYFIVKNIRNKKLIAEQTIAIKEQHIQDLEKERQLIATKSVLKGEESERSRMACDLHDGLGGMLSGVKINLSSMKGNSIITNENAMAFDHVIHLLDTSISELRRVAHNLMPETLNHYGLKTALNDFVAEMGSNNPTELAFRFFGEDVRFDTQLELTVYRISQELVNNALKHSQAKNINIQLIAEADRVCVQVVDNGKGFDTKSQLGFGKGLVSIRDRVAANNGTFDLESTPGQGTEASLEFLLS